MSSSVCRILTAGVILGLCVLPARAQQGGASVDDLMEKTIRAVAEKVSPCIVQIETSGGTDVISTGPRGPKILKGTGPTSGVLVSPEGYVATSAFNFANKPSDIIVTVPGKKQRYVAKVVASDHSRMITLLQLLQVAPADLPMPVPTAAPKADIRIGNTSIALGRTLDPNLTHLPSISVGIISAVDRIWGRAMQTDAKISPVNYGGPLVDLSGRVMGILVPASPQAENETAGVEWYDSGIGFAIPMEDILAVLPRLKEGKDLQRGLLGITLRGQDIYSAPAVVELVTPDSAAAQAGLLNGDEIIEIDGKPVTRQAQLRHILGPRYEGDEVTLKVKRTKDGKDEMVTLEKIKLTGPLASAATPFLGILPLRDDPELGLEVRYVFPKSPAEAAGLKAGDRIMKVQAPGTGANRLMIPFSGREELARILGAVPTGGEVKLEVQRKEGKKTETLTAHVAEAVEEVPAELPEPSTLKKALTPRKSARPMPRGQGAPKAEEPKKEDPKKKPETGIIKRSNVTQDRQYWMYVPEDYDPNISYGMVLWLHPVNKNKDRDFDDLQFAWEPYCKKYHLILVAPKAESETGWVASDSDFIRDTINEVVGQYTIDRDRVVAHGWGLGGQMAFYIGFQLRTLIRGVATTGSVMTSNPKENRATQRLAFYIVAGAKDPLLKSIADSKDKLTERKFPVIYREIPEMGNQYLDTRTLEEMVRWIDTLDRL